MKRSIVVLLLVSFALLGARREGATYELCDTGSGILKWEFPNISLAGGDCLLIFASGKDVTDIAELHTNFKIDREGEYLA